MGGVGKRTRLPVAKRRAFITTEIVFSLFLIAGIAALAANVIFDYRQTSHHYLWRHAAIWAVDAQLQRYHAGAALDSQPPAGLIPEEITLKTTHQPGRGQWQGFNRVTVTASTALPSGKVIYEQVSTYIPAEAKP